jgi:hypothetical protein
MDNAIVYSVSSEQSNHPAEHAISPLEPNFAWEANEASAKHTLVIDLGAPYEADGFTFLHHELEQSTPSQISTVIQCESSNDASTWTSHTLKTAYGLTPDSIDPNNLIKIRHFADAPVAARYWRFTVEGITPPFEYALACVGYLAITC